VAVNPQSWFPSLFGIPGGQIEGSLTTFSTNLQKDRYTTLEFGA
jgi:hypothetical protein